MRAHIRSGLHFAVVATASLLLLAACKTGSDPAQAEREDLAPSTLAQASDDLVDLGSGLDTTLMPVASSSGAYLAAQAAIMERDMAAASDYLLVALASDPDNKDLLRQTHFALVSSGRIPEALPIARKLMIGEGIDQFSPLTLAADALDRDVFDDAEAALIRLPINGYNTILVPLLEAWVAAAKGDFDDAMAAIGPTDAGDGFDALRAYHIGLIEDLAGRADAAEVAFERSMAGQVGGAYRVVLAYGAFLERQGKIDAAREVYSSFLATNPDSLWLDATLARLDAGGAPPEQIDEAREGASEALFAVASSAQQNDGPEVGLAYGQLAAYLVPQNDVVALLIGDIFEAQGKHDDAVDAYRRINASSPLHWSARLRIALNLDDAGHVDQAIAILHQMVEEKTERADSLVMLGDILRIHERWAEAVDAYDLAFERMAGTAEGDWRLRYVRGIALERSGDWDRAEDDFVAALEIQPEHPFVLNYLGYTWVDRSENLDEALNMIERAVNQRPTDGFIIDSLGWAYYRLGRYEEAVAQLERAVEYEPGDAVINDHLGDAFWQVGRHAEARFQWRRAVSLSGDDAALTATIQSKLQSGLERGDDG
ncbi:MAG: tetratricopeptide repeat protein [Alphaproteobacteria bacterium]|jgi:tetratricopeptide (TPR) repeat protein|nr:tetratricopeptide repeat protein [Rhodospirillaceae bacterium]MBT7646874.1 tetratricopeptide repeat protein [Rhodospirillaceae bacterium]MDG2479594.1 tetratricopeptide repeat protein [Alphaproteobacteria bacterium]